MQHFAIYSAMKRITVYITEHEFTAIQHAADTAGIKFAEMLRRLLDEALQQYPKPQKTPSS